VGEFLGAILPFLRTVWHSRLTRWLSPLILAIVVLFFSSGSGAKLPGLPSWVFALAGAIVILLVWEVTHRLPRPRPGTIGIGVALVCDNEAHEQQVKADFIDRLNTCLHADDAAPFSLVVAPGWAARAVENNVDAGALCKRMKCHFLIFGSVRRRIHQGRGVTLLNFEGVVRHAKLSKAAATQMQTDFRETLPRRVTLDQQNEAFEFEATSEWADTSARYIIGMAALFSGAPQLAEQLLLSVERAMPTKLQRINPLRALQQRLPARINQLYGIWLESVQKAYVRRREREDIILAEQLARRALKRNPESYQARLAMAMAAFVLYRDVAGARVWIEKCRRERDATWRFSRAFLLAYEGNMKRAREEYREAFIGKTTDPSIPVQVEEFINLILEAEPERAQLHFCLGLINMESKEDFEAAARDFRVFLDSEYSSAFAEERSLAQKYLQRMGQTTV